MNIVKTFGACLGFSGFLAVWIGCMGITLCAYTGVEAPLIIAGLLAIVAGATLAGAWYRP